MRYIRTAVNCDKFAQGIPIISDNIISKLYSYILTDVFAPLFTKIGRCRWRPVLAMQAENKKNLLDSQKQSFQDSESKSDRAYQWELLTSLIFPDY